MGFQQRFRCLQVKILFFSFVHTAAQPLEQSIIEHIAVYAVAETDDLRRGEPPQFRCGCLGIGADGREESTGGDIAECKAEPASVAVEAGHVVVLAFFQHAAFRHCAGGDDAGDVPFYQALGQGGVRQLFADGHLVALLHQPGDVGVHRMEGNAAHGGLLFLGLVPIPGGQSQVQLPGGHPGVFVEHFVEVTQTEEQDAVLVSLFDLIILALHGRHFVGRVSHIICPLLHNAKFKMHNAK